MFSNQNLQRICTKYYCEYCDYKTCRKSSYDEHNLSTKHQKSMISNQNLHKICNEYICQNCNKNTKIIQDYGDTKRNAIHLNIMVMY